MRTRVKRLPRLWCALQGMLPLEACWAAQRGELAWSVEAEAEALHSVRIKLAGSASKAKKLPSGGADAKKLDPNRWHFKRD